jgi:hypothetical protein
MLDVQSLVAVRMVVVFVFVSCPTEEVHGSLRRELLFAACIPEPSPEPVPVPIQELLAWESPLAQFPGEKPLEVQDRQ